MISYKNVRKFCYEPLENIENYQEAVNDPNEIWHCHHRVETIMNCGWKELRAKGCYYHRPAHELIFLRKGDHTRCHFLGRKTQCSEDHRRRLSESRKGIQFSEEHRRHISESKKGCKGWWLGKHHSDETKRKLSEARLGKKMSMECRRKMSESRRGLRWFTDGTITVKARECPEGFRVGRA